MLSESGQMTGSIVIDDPDKGDYHFYHEKFN